jgi:hypothetical protein
MAISIIGLDEEVNHENFIIRKLSPTFYRIEESAILLEIINNNTLIVTTVVIDNASTNPPKAKVATKEYLYRTKDNNFLKFIGKDGQLVVTQMSSA